MGIPLGAWRAALAAVVGVAAVAGPVEPAALAAEAPARDPISQILAPLLDAARWLEGPAQDLTDPEVLSHVGEAGLVAPLRVAVDTVDDAIGSIAAGSDVEALSALAQDAYDSLLHMKPDVPLTHAPDAGHPAYAPDWNGNGTYAEGADYRRDIDGRLDVGVFRYPCIGYDGEVTFQRTDGTCGPADDDGRLATGVARELKVVDGRGFILDATVWIPGQALRRRCDDIGAPACAAVANVRPGQPSVVFHNGLASRQDHYYWYAMRLARAGYVVLTYDPAGQGESEGTVADLFTSNAGCSGSCMDAQDVTRWWLGEEVAEVDVGQQRPFSGFHDPASRDAGGDNVRNPYRGVLDAGRVALSGNSMGAAATVSYLNALAEGAGDDGTGRPVPPIAAAIPLSIPGETTMAAPVPVLMITGDLDGFPLVGPAVAGTGWADDHLRMYASLRGPRRRPMPVGVVVIEGGVHTDHVDQALIPSTRWGIALTEHYAVAWLDCHVRGDAGACARTLAPAPHLSGAFASQVDPDGSGPEPNRCLAVPDRASLGQDLPALLAALVGDHAPCPR